MRWLCTVFAGAVMFAAGCSASPRAQPFAVEHASIVHVSGVACGSLAVGGGVAVATDRIVTNAHVVAGVEAVEVTLVGSDEPLPGAVIGFDPNRDLALVEIDEQVLVPVEIDETVESGPVLLAIVPTEGPVATRDTTISRVIVATGDDIYRREGASRRALELAGDVVAGESGSGLFGPEGGLVGIVFASSSNGDERSYAVAASEVTAFLAEAELEADPAGPCLSEPAPAPDEAVIGDPSDNSDQPD